MIERDVPAEAVDSWMETNLETIIEAMEAARVERVNDMDQDAANPWSPAFNIKRRHLSEMPICGFWEKIKPPSGFSVINGLVFCPSINVIDGQFYLKISSHLFAKSKDLILCLTPGQFIPYLAYLEPGPGIRIEVLQKRAPGLVKVYDNKRGIAALSGTPQEIFQSLWWEYLSEGEREQHWADNTTIQRYREIFGNREFKMPHATK